MPSSPLLGRARDLRLNQTHCEALVWQELRSHRLGGWKWRRQAPRGPYIVDFYCAERSLVVELDRTMPIRSPTTRAAPGTWKPLA
jgi:very-short-patch-repair endonuclease